MKIKLLLILLLWLSICHATMQQGSLLGIANGKIVFQSEAPFETIKATSNELKGLVDIDKKTFAFKVRMVTFDGFNSALQKEHFNENYVESTQFPEASFNGKIIEDVDLKQDGVYAIRAKGVFNLHGVAQERIIKCDVTVKAGKMYIRSSFSVLLADHNIPVPKVVKDKLNSDINVQVSCVMEPRAS